MHPTPNRKIISWDHYTGLERLIPHTHIYYKLPLTYNCVSFYMSFMWLTTFQVRAVSLKGPLNNKHYHGDCWQAVCPWVCLWSEIRVCINAADSRKANMNNLQQARMWVMTLMCALFFVLFVSLTPCSPHRWKRSSLWLVCLFHYLQPLMSEVDFTQTKINAKSQR